MSETRLSSERAVSPLAGLFIVANLGSGRLIGRIIATVGDLALVEARSESDVQGPGFILLKLGSMALPEGRCRLFRTRKELAKAVSAGECAPVRPRSVPQLVVARPTERPHPSFLER